MRAAFLLVMVARATLCCALMMLAPAARAADKVVAGTLGGQAPLWPFYIALHKGFFAAEDWLSTSSSFKAGQPSLSSSRPDPWMSR